MVEVVIENTGERLDVTGGIKYTFQTSEIGDISEINSSWSWTIRFPKSVNNARIFQGLGTVGSTSPTPYISIKVSVLYHSVPIVENANLKVSETVDGEYKGNIVSGIVDFFNNIKNTTLEQIVAGQGNLSHDKTLQVIIDSWIADPFAGNAYRYIIADYNGKLNPDNDYTDFQSPYLIPSVNVKWLVDLIFSTFGWTYTGLENIDLDWMTYGNKLQEEGDVGLTVGNVEVLGIDNLNINDRTANFDLIFSSNSEVDPNFVTMIGGDITIMQDELYAIVLPRIVLQNGYYGALSYIRVYKNGVFYMDIRADKWGVEYSLGNLSNSDTITIGARLELINSGQAGWSDISFVGNVNIIASNATVTDYQGASLEYNAVEFMKEVMLRNASIAVPDVKNKSIAFLNIEDRLEAPIVDWSSKFVKRTSESYIYNNYAIRNYLRHTYEKEGEEYHDGFFTIDNVNLEQKHTVYKSKTFASNQHLSILKDEVLMPGFKSYEIEVKNNGEVYKPLNDRFYFMRGEFVYDVGSIKLDGVAYLEYYKAIPRDFDVIIEEEYQGIAEILNTVKIMNIDLILNLFDIKELRFDVRYYFSQEAAFFLLNKLTWDSNQNITKAEFIKIAQEATGII